MFCDLAGHDLFWSRLGAFGLVGRRFGFVAGLAAGSGHCFTLPCHG